MGRGRKGSGVEARERSIRLAFTWHGKRYREPLALPPTPANLKYAMRLAADIRRAIDAGTFRLKDFFSESKQVIAEQKITLSEAGDLWLASKGRLAPATRSQYRWALNFWNDKLGAKTDVLSITHGAIAALVGSHPWPSAKLCNNALIPLRGLFKLACKESKTENPTDGIENTKGQKPTPDPFSPDETEAILSDLYQRYDPRVGAYFEFAFSPVFAQRSRLHCNGPILTGAWVRRACKEFAHSGVGSGTPRRIGSGMWI